MDVRSQSSIRPIPLDEPGGLVQAPDPEDLGNTLMGSPWAKAARAAKAATDPGRTSVSAADPGRASVAEMAMHDDACLLSVEPRPSYISGEAVASGAPESVDPSSDLFNAPTGESPPPRIGLDPP